MMAMIYFVFRQIKQEVKVKSLQLEELAANNTKANEHTMLIPAAA